MNKVTIIFLWCTFVLCNSHENNNDNNTVLSSKLEFTLSEFGNGQGFIAHYSIVDCLNLHEEIDWEFRKIRGIKNPRDCVRICEESWCGNHCLELRSCGNQIWNLNKCSITLENNHIERNFEIKSIGPCGIFPGRNVLKNTCELNKSSTLTFTSPLYFMIIFIILR